MKRFFIFAVLLCVISAVTDAYAVKAEAYKYLRVIDSTTPLFSDAAGADLLCFLPYTYYVKQLDDTGDMIRVECYGDDGGAALEGFVPKDKLFDDGLDVADPYADLTLTAAQSTVLYYDKELTKPQLYVFPERQMRYFGQMTESGKYIYFVGFGDRVGYIEESGLYPFTLPDHPNELTFLAPEPEEKPVPESPARSDLLSMRIVIVVCLVFAGLIGLFIAFRPKNKKQPAITYYDENDYE